MTNPGSQELVLALQALRPEIRAMLAEDLPEDLRRAELAYSRKEWAALHSHVHRVNGSASFCKLAALKGGPDHVAIRNAIEALGRATEEFAARRMNESIRRALTGRRLDEIS